MKINFTPQGYSVIFALWIYRKIPKISPSKYKPPGVLYLEIALKYKVKQGKNSKFSSNHKASQVDFETQIFLPR